MKFINKFINNLLKSRENLEYFLLSFTLFSVIVGLYAHYLRKQFIEISLEVNALYVAFMIFSISMILSLTFCFNYLNQNNNGKF